MKTKLNNMFGFTLIEVMVTLLIVSVGMLALGAFYSSLIGSESDAQKRLAAVHMAEQLIEDWQKNSVLPTPDCTLTTGPSAGNAAGQLSTGTSITACQVNMGTKIKFDILLKTVSAKGPVPPNHLNNPNASALNKTKLAVLLTDPADAGSLAVKVRSVRVSWDHKGQTKFVVLTSIRRPT